MGFFDFLNRQGETGAAGKAEFQPLSAETMTSTGMVKTLLEVPKKDRNQAWTRQFIAHVANAAFFPRDPCVIQSDNFPFFALSSTQTEQAYPTYVIHHMKDDILLVQGMGVVINPSGQDADWAFTYGDILNFQINGAFYPPAAGAAAVSHEPLPAEARLPLAARKVLRTFLQKLGVAAPRVMFGAQDHSGPGSQELLFDFSPQDFKSLDDFHFAMNNLSWFLPRNYSYSLAGNQARKGNPFQAL